jgi:O-antigen/teichoic acid export membrane protein
MASLTKKSMLLSFSSVIDIILKSVAAIFVTRLIADKLGANLYGAWTMILQILGYIALTNLNTSSTLKIRLAAINHQEDNSQKQLLLSASRKLFHYTLLLTFFVSLLTIYFSGKIFTDNTASISEINIVLVIGVLALIVDQYGGLYGNALRGSNLDYKGIKIRSLAFIISNVFIIVFLYFGLGIIGLAISSLLGSIITALSWRNLTKKILGWYKIVKVNSDFFYIYFKQSMLTLVYSLGNIVLVNSDAILMGIVMGNKYAGFYFISTTFIRSLIIPVITILLSSTGVGLSSLINTKNNERIRAVTAEILQIAAVIIGAGGVLYILFNENLIHYWVGHKFYSGENVEVFFVIMVVVQFSNTLIQYLIDGLQLYKEKAIVSIISTLFFVPASIILLKNFGLKGFISASLLSSLISIFSYFQIMKKMNCSYIHFKLMVLRWFSLAGLFFAVSVFFKPLIPILPIMYLILLIIISSFFLGILVFFLLPNSFKIRLVSNKFFKKESS